jgi:hypothetical protein
VLEDEVSGVLEGERLVVVTPNAGVLMLEGSEALVMAELEFGVDAGALEVDVGFAVLVEALEVGGVTGVAAVTPTAVLVEVTGA